jgi:hypothetical protein
MPKIAETINFTWIGVDRLPGRGGKQTVRGEELKEVLPLLSDNIKH